MSFTQTTDYKGFYQITQNSHSVAELQTYIDDLEPERLRDLLGCTLFDLFTADLVGGVPQAQRFKDIFDPFCDDDGNTTGLQQRSQGIPVMLKGFVYYDYVKDSDFSNVITGNIKNEFSNSVTSSSVEYGLRQRYNRAILSYEAIQWFIWDNLTDYPEYNGIAKELTVWL